MAWHLSAIQGGEEKQGNGMQGWEMAAPVAKWVLQKYLVYTGIFVWRRVSLLERREEISMCLFCGQFGLFCRFDVSVLWLGGCWEDLGAVAA